MSYNYYAGVIKEKTKIVPVILALLLTMGLALSQFMLAKAATSSVLYVDVPLSQTEIDNNWFTDRAEPSGGYGSVNYNGRNNVLEMNIDGTDRSSVSSFYYTEGLQRNVDDALGLKGDVYLESNWLAHNVRVGLWGVGHNASEAISAYPITEFTTAGVDNFTGWRVWDGVLGGWTNLTSVGYNLNSWNSLQIVFNSTTGMFDHYINGVVVHSTTGDDTQDFGAVILNNYNYGPTGTNYSVHWSNYGHGSSLLFSPDTTAECKKDGWKNYTGANGIPFKNQGECVRFVANGKQ